MFGKGRLGDGGGLFSEGRSWTASGSRIQRVDAEVWRTEFAKGVTGGGRRMVESKREAYCSQAALVGE